MQKSLPVTASDKRMSKKHLKARIKLAKKSAKMNREHKMDHENGEKRALKDLGAAYRRLKTVERL